MGNFMETCTQRALQEEEEMMGQNQQGGGAGSEAAGEFFKEKGLEKSMRVKIVLTKDELEWLLFQLQVRGGGSGELQAFLGDLEMRSREKAFSAGWKPSLESITECPELPHTMDR